MDKKVVASRASDWRKWKEEGYFIEFPSGVSAFIRPVALDMLLESRYVPNDLIPHVEEMLSSQRRGIDGTIEQMGIVEAMRNNSSFSKAIAYASFISPRVVEEPREDNEISPDDISPEDMQFLVRWTSQPASDLRKFSQDQIAGLEPLPPWGSDEPETQPDS